jgi:hypothetical protein
MVRPGDAVRAADDASNSANISMVSHPKLAGVHGINCHHHAGGGGDYETFSIGKNFEFQMGT